MKPCKYCGIAMDETNTYTTQNGNLMAVCKKCRNLYNGQNKAKPKISEQYLKYKADSKGRCKKCGTKKKYYPSTNKYICLKCHLDAEKQRRANDPQYKEKRNNYRAQRMQSDVNFRILERYRSRINMALKRNSKSATSVELLGCDMQSLRQYIEKQFSPGMSWDNYGKWHIDHIRPCASFDLSDPSQQKQCFNYTNLQPLWAEENMRKGASW